MMDFDTTDSEELLKLLSENNRSDGLPVIPPTTERVERMLEQSSRDQDEVITQIPVTFPELTVKSLARCSVMAGCRPEYFPVVVTAFEAMAEWDNLQAVTSTTGGFWIATIVNGPIRDELNINCGTGLYGPGYRANATIGRAISLAFLIEGGVYPGEGTMASQAHPGRYTFCFGEREKSIDWEPLHADLADMDPGMNAVTVITAHSPQLVSEGNDHDPAPTQEDVLKAFARCGAYPGAAAAAKPGEVAFVVSADHAQRLSEEYTKREFKEYMYENCRLPYTERPLLRSPDDAIVVVAGGISNMSSIIHTFTYAETEAVTKQIK